MTLIVGIMGPAGSGKSTVANYLVERYGAVRYSLAGPLKEFAKNALGFTDEQLYGTQAQKEAPDERYGGFSARWFLQRLGTEGARRTFGEDFWARRCIEKIESDGRAVFAREGRSLIAVVDDVRFVNEAELLRERRETRTRLEPTRVGVIWRLESPNRETAEAESTHASETEWARAPYDYLIKPLGRGIPQLHALVDDACRKFIIFPKRRELGL